MALSPDRPTPRPAVGPEHRTRDSGIVILVNSGERREASTWQE